MADTVVQVYVWDGTNWVEVVTDNPSQLPIASEDGTVIIAGSNNLQTTTVAGAERMRVAPDYFRLSTTSGNLLFVEQTGTVQTMWVGGKAGSGGSGQVVIQAPQEAGEDKDGRSLLFCSGTSTGDGEGGSISFAISAGSTKGTAQNPPQIVMKVDSDGRLIVGAQEVPDPELKAYINGPGNFAGSLTVDDFIRTGEIKGPAGGDADIFLDANFEVHGGTDASMLFEVLADGDVHAARRFRASNYTSDTGISSDGVILVDSEIKLNTDSNTRIYVKADGDVVIPGSISDGTTSKTITELWEAANSSPAAAELPISGETITLSEDSSNQFVVDSNGTELFQTPYAFSGQYTQSAVAKFGGNANNLPVVNQLAPAQGESKQGFLLYQNDNRPDVGMSVDWVFAGGAFNAAGDQRCVSIEGYRPASSAVFELGFKLRATSNGEMQQPLTIKGDGSILAQDGYVPNAETSLITKGWLAENGASGELPISSEDASVTLQSPAEDEFELELAGEMQLRITDKDIQASVGYEGLSDNSLITRSMLYGYGEGGTPISPPGYNSGESWESVDYPNASQINGPHITVAADGIFSNGGAWSVNGEDWFATTSRIDGLGIYPIAYSSGAYITYRYFSYDMKNWAEIRRVGITAPFFWQGYFFCAATGGVVSSGGQSTGSGSWGPGTRPGYGRTISPDRPVLPAAFNYRIFRAATSDWEVPTYDWAIKPLADDVVDGADQYPFMIYHQSSKPDGTMTLASQEMNSNLTDKRICYIADNPNITVDRPWAWEFVQVPGLTEISGTALKGIAYDESEDRWVVLTDAFSFVCRGNPTTSTWRKYPLPNAGDWCENFHFNGENFIAVTSATGSNLCISSSDGENWLRSTSINIASDSNYLCGTNGRSLLVTPYSSSTQPTPPMQLTGGLEITGPTTAEVILTEPVETNAAYTQRTGRATLTTQSDANVYFDDAINLRAFVVTLTQTEYDAIPSDQLDDQTLYCITD